MFQNHDRKLKFQPGKFRWHFFLHYLHIKSVIVISSCYILLFLSATLWQKVNLHIHLYSHFTQNSVVNVNWHINKKNNEIWQIIVRKLKKLKRFSGVGGATACSPGASGYLKAPLAITHAWHHLKQMSLSWSHQTTGHGPSNPCP